MNVSSTLNQKFHDFRLLVSYRPHQGCLTRFGFSRVDISSMIEQSTDSLGLPAVYRAHERSLTRNQRGIRISFGFQQQFDNGCIALSACSRKGSGTIFVSSVDVCSGSNQQFHNFQIIALRRPDQRRGTVGSSRVDISVVLQKLSDSVMVCVADGVDQSEVCASFG